MNSADIVCFAHGKESGPWGTKIKKLAGIAKSKGFLVESPDYSDLSDPDKRVARLLAVIPETLGKRVLVGSSMGAYVSTVASKVVRPDGLFLLAPAFYLQGYNNQDPRPHARFTAIVHGWNDEVVPVENAIKFAQKYKSDLHLLDGDHRLVSAMSEIEKLFDHFLGRLLSES